MNEPIAQAIRDQATSWFVRSQDVDFAVEDWRALHQWLAADPAHADAFAEAEGLWIDAEAGEAALTAENIIPMRAPSPRPKIKPMWLAVGAALAASIVAAVVFGLGPGSAPSPVAPPSVSPTVYASLAGEQKAVVLQDGTRVKLNGGTRLSIVFTGAERWVTMDGGEAMFDVTHDPNRPFLIALGDRRLRVIGTQFNILKLPSKLEVTVKRGVVAVEPIKSAGQALRLTAGRRLVHAPGSTDSQVQRVDPDKVLGWSEGRLSYTRAPLSKVGDDLGRYLGKPVQVDDDIAAMPFTGVLNMDQEDRVLRRLEAFLPVHVQASDAGIRLSRASGR